MKTWDNAVEISEDPSFSAFIDSEGRIHQLAEAPQQASVSSFEIDLFGGVSTSPVSIFRLDDYDRSIQGPGFPFHGRFDRAVVLPSGRFYLYRMNAMEDSDDLSGYDYEKFYSTTFKSYTGYSPADGSETYESHHSVVSFTTYSEDYYYYGDYYGEEPASFTSYDVDKRLVDVDQGLFSAGRILFSSHVSTEIRETRNRRTTMRSSEELVVQVVDPSASRQAALVTIDATPVSDAAVVQRADGQLGVIWINSLAAASALLSMNQFKADGSVSKSYGLRLQASHFAPSGPISSVTLADALTLDSGRLVVLISVNGVPHLVRLTEDFRSAGAPLALPGVNATRERVRDAQLLKIPGGGFVLAASLERDGTAGGRDHRILVQEFSASGEAVGSQFKVAADSGRFEMLQMADGRINMSWVDGGATFQQIFDLARSALDDLGTSGNDTTIGTAFNDTLHGSDGMDRLVAGAGADKLFGDAGNDLLIGGIGGDRLDGGEGRDVVRYFSAVTVDLENCSLNTGEARGDLLSSIEQLRGSHQADALYGSSASETLDGQQGDDILSGRGGDDVLIGRGGRDLLIGGEGADQFRFDEIQASPDTIEDFTLAKDHIVVSKSGFHFANLAVVSNGNPVAPGRSPAFLFNATTKELIFDANGSVSGGQALVATLNGVTGLTAGDFSVVS